jgi:transcriptional regulator with XRE-family HTH domain
VKEEPEEKKVDQDARLAMVLLRFFKDWEQGDLAREARIAPSQVSVYDRGKRTVPADVLGRAADAAEFPRYLLGPMKRAIRSFRAAARGRSRAGRVLGDEVFAELIDLSRLAIDTVLGDSLPETGRKAPSSEDREEAAELWARMERRTPKQRRALVEEAEELRSWALCERVAAASAEAAAGSPVQAKELAGLALLIAELAPGEAAWRSRLQGYAWAHLSRARLACGDRAGAGEAHARARSLWEAGAAGDPGLLDETVLLGLAADLRRA